MIKLTTQKHWILEHVLWSTRYVKTHRSLYKYLAADCWELVRAIARRGR